MYPIDTKIPEDSLVHSPHDSALLEYAARTLEEIAASYHIPFLRPIANVSRLISNDLKLTKTKKDIYLRLVDLMHTFECIIIAISAAHRNDLDLKTLDTIGHFAETLQRIHGCLRSQRDLGRIRRFLQQTEITRQLELCQTELQGALDTLKLEQLDNVTRLIASMELSAKQRHQQLLSLLEAQHDSERSIIKGNFENHHSSSSLTSLLPPPPQIFHGRQEELKEVVHTLQTSPACVAILGSGGIGKTALATAILHHPDIASRYEHRYFVSCEAANTSNLLISAVGLHMGLEPSRRPIDMIIQYFSHCGPALLLLDNLETAWEDSHTRSDVEEFLSLLSGVQKLALVITMRGLERPGRVKWSRPFLAPLKPLDSTASRQIFIEVSDAPNSEQEEADLAELMEFTGNLPLAVSLMASVTASEGYSNSLRHWKTDNTLLLSEGQKKTSNLDKSIVMSLTSPRMISSPGAQELLSVLSLLPDGLAEVECTAQNIPILHILESKSVLLRTSLAYIDSNGRLKTLSPIREYIRRENPPHKSLVDPLGKYWQDLLSLWDSHKQLPGKDTAFQLSANVGNINSLIFYQLQAQGPPTREVLHSILTLEIFSQNMLKLDSILLPLVPKYINSLGDKRLHCEYLMLRLRWSGPPVPESEAGVVIPETLKYLYSEHDPKTLALFCHAVVKYYLRAGDLARAIEFNEIGKSLPGEIGDDLPKALSYSDTAEIERRLGNYHKAVFYASKGRIEARKEGTILDELYCVVQEAGALVHLGDLSHASELCDTAHRLVVAHGLQGSDLQLSILDMAAEIAYNQGEFERGAALYQSIAQQTSLTKSPRFHIYASLSLIAIDILLGTTGTISGGKIEELKETSDFLKWSQGCLFAAILQADLNLCQGQRIPALVQCFRSAQKSGDALNTFRCLERLNSQEATQAVESNLWWPVTYLALAYKKQNLLHLYQSLICLGDILTQWGDTETALNLFHTAREGLNKMGCMSRIKQIPARSNKSEERPLEFPLKEMGGESLS
ncbi:hypothetical protein DFH09DRAFT_129101 [Mycena vulgaris]|nr:hypothetical protein DFH09DRAFT_129101 [Mycena vulgaris]